MYQAFKNDVVLGADPSFLTECKVRAVEIDAKGQRTFRVDMGWWSGVRKNADKEGFDAAVVVMNAKYGDQPMALITLDTLLDLLSSAHGVKKSQSGGGEQSAP